MKLYLDCLRDILDNGVDKQDRTGTGTRSVFGRQLRFDLAEGFPLLTTKKMYIKGIIHELLWFIKGDTNIEYLNQNGVRIWVEWADANGDLGPIYGKQWRDFNGIDQLSNLINDLKTNPDSRRLIISAWNPGDIPLMALPPCHCLFQFYVANNRLSCHLYQRSADAFLGVPFNIASYSLLTMMVANVTGYQYGDFIHTFGDFHIYHNHFDQVNTQLSRAPYPLPRMEINPQINDIFKFTAEDFSLEDYTSHPAIRAPIAI